MQQATSGTCAATYKLREPHGQFSKIVDFIKTLRALINYFVLDILLRAELFDEGPNV